MSPFVRHTTGRTPAAAAGIALLLVVALACATNPVTGKKQLALITEEQELAIGKETHEQVLASMGIYEDRELQRYVDEVGQRLARESERPNLPWTFTVIDDPSVNAFALPGGYIYLTRGILGHMASEAEMASVLGHEIGHVTARHSVERISKAQLAQVGLIAGMIVSPELRNYGDLAQTGLGVLFLKFGRDDERQADELGLKYMTQHNYDPLEMAEMFQVLDRVSQTSTQGKLPNWLSTHPNPRNRITNITQAVQASPAELAGRTVGRDRFLTHLENMEFGEDPREGYFVGNAFYHPDLRFKLEFPPGWKTSNQRQAVAAISPNEDAVVVLSLAPGGSPRDAARQFFSQPGIRQGNAWQGSIGGFPTVSSSFLVDRQRGGDIRGLVAFLEQGDTVYQLIGYTLANRYARYDDLLARSMGSFSRLTERRYLDVQPKRIDLVTLPQPMDLAEFDRRYPSTVDLQTLAIINHVEPGERLEQGKKYKRVVGGELPTR